MKLPGRNAVVITDTFGQKAGSYLAAFLLAQELDRLDLRVTCFAQSIAITRDSMPKNIRLITPLIRRGWRWDFPGKCLAWQAKQFMQRRKPDFVFVCGLTRLARYLLKSSVGNRLLIWENTNAQPGNKFVDAEASRLLGRARAVLSPSNTIDQCIRQTYDYHGKLWRLPFWIEEQNKLSSAPPAEFVADFIYLGRRDPEKGLNELVRATSEVAKSFPYVRVLIAGSGTEKPFADLARELGIEKNITFKFFESREETMNALAKSKYLVLSSYHEGYPLVLLEALQQSVPFISTEVGSVPELYGDSSAALLVPPRDALALAKAMKQAMVETSTAYLVRRSAAHRSFQQLSSRQAVVTRLEALLQSADAEGKTVD